MGFDEWLSETKQGYTKGGVLYDVGKQAWNAAIAAATEAVDYADYELDAPAIDANKNAKDAVIALKET